jgi:hypothetical protein
MNVTWYIDEYFHYVIFVFCIVYLIIMWSLKIIYNFWYSQPLSLRVSPYWWWYAISYSLGKNPRIVSIRHPLSNNIQSISLRSNNSLFIPFIYNVNNENIKVYHTSKISRTYDIESIPFSEIAHLINTSRYHDHGSFIGNCSRDFLCPYVDAERFALTTTNDTHGLSPFVGVYYRKTYTQNTQNTVKELLTVEGASFLLPRQKLEYNIQDSRYNREKPAVITTIYVCDFSIWNHTLLTEHQSLELLETTEYFQKSREIAGELTLYRYSKIPWFVVPFSTVYSYGISLDSLFSTTHSAKLQFKYEHIGTLLVKVTSVNFDIFYRFMNECSRDFRCSILHPISHIQHLVNTGLYTIYILILNNTVVLSVYIFAPSWLKSLETSRHTARFIRKKQATKSHRDHIRTIHERISKTSTALVKYLPSKDEPQYDRSGKRIRPSETNKSLEHSHQSFEIPRLLSSFYSKHHCDSRSFVKGFLDASRDLTKSSSYITSNNTGMFTHLIIDTFAHNHILLDHITNIVSPLWIDKWYYVMYNGSIHTELLCKDILIV